VYPLAFSFRRLQLVEHFIDVLAADVVLVMLMGPL
jgi:hypothetical protein